jgi:hypothetical protein
MVSRQQRLYSSFLTMESCPLQLYTPLLCSRMQRVILLSLLADSLIDADHSLPTNVTQARDWSLPEGLYTALPSVAS